MKGPKKIQKKICASRMHTKKWFYIYRHVFFGICHRCFWPFFFFPRLVPIHIEWSSSSFFFLPRVIHVGHIKNKQWALTKENPLGFLYYKRRFVYSNDLQRTDEWDLLFDQMATYRPVGAKSSEYVASWQLSHKLHRYSFLFWLPFDRVRWFLLWQGRRPDTCLLSCEGTENVLVIH